MKKRQRTLPRKRNSSEFRKRTLSVGASNLTDNKVNHLSLHLEYLFEWGVNFRNRVITITGEISYPLFDIIDAAMTEMEAQSKKAITVRIHSEGGSVYEALAVVGRLRRSKCKIITEGYGCILSAATLLLACGDERFISPMAWVMHHGSIYGLHENKHTVNKATIEQVEREEKEWAKWMEEFTNKPAAFWYKKGSIVDAYFNADETLELGIADKLMRV